MNASRKETPYSECVVALDSERTSDNFAKTFRHRTSKEQFHLRVMHTLLKSGSGDVCLTQLEAICNEVIEPI